MTYEVSYIVNGVRVYPDGTPVPVAPAAPADAPAGNSVIVTDLDEATAKKLMKLSRDQLVTAAESKGITVPEEVQKADIVGLIMAAPADAPAGNDGATE